MSTSYLSLNNIPPPKTKKPLPSNRIRLAAVSNYKLAQLTFAPPDGCTLRRTALIKSLVDVIYKHTPNEYLSKQMMRWGYFTPESLEDMTQKDVEKIIYRYSQIVYSTAIHIGKDGANKEQQFLYTDYPEITAETKEMEEMNAYYTSLFSSSVFSDDVPQDEFTCSSSDSEEEEEKEPSLPNQQYQQKQQQQHQPKLGIVPNMPSAYQLRHPNNSNNNNNNNEKAPNRLSWLSDTGVPTNSALALNLASELMSLFDMEFNVDLSLPALHDLKKLESSNGSTTSLHKVFSANEYPSSDEEEPEAVQVNLVGLNHAAETQIQQKEHEELVNEEKSLQQQQQSFKKKGFKLIPTLKQLSNKNKSNSDESLSTASSKTAPATPTHEHYRAELAPSHEKEYQYYYNSSSDSEEEEEEEDDDISYRKTASPHRITTSNHLGNVNRVLPPNRSSSLDYRASLQHRFELSEEEEEDSSDASSDYFNDSVDTFQVELNCSRDSAGVNSPSFKGFLSALSGIRKTKSSSSRSGSIHQIEREHQDPSYPTIPVSRHTSTQTAVDLQGSSSFDGISISSGPQKRKNSMQKMVQYLSGNSVRRNNSTKSNPAASIGRRGSSISNNMSVSATSTVMSGSSFFNEDCQNHPRNMTPPTSPITLSPRVAKRHGVYTTSIISDTSSFNWADETRQKEHFGSIRSKASSSKTVPNIFSINSSKYPKPLSRSSSTTSIGSFFKKLTAFNKKDKKLQRA